MIADSKSVMFFFYNDIFFNVLISNNKSAIIYDTSTYKEMKNRANRFCVFVRRSKITYKGFTIKSDK